VELNTAQRAGAAGEEPVARGGRVGRVGAGARRAVEVEPAVWDEHALPARVRAERLRDVGDLVEHAPGLGRVRALGVGRGAQVQLGRAVRFDRLDVQFHETPLKIGCCGSGA
jgi:hypothetical protein